jgi:hypothetical protein
MKHKGHKADTELHKVINQERCALCDTLRDLRGLLKD